MSLAEQGMDEEATRFSLALVPPLPEEEIPQIIGESVLDVRGPILDTDSQIPDSLVVTAKKLDEPKKWWSRKTDTPDAVIEKPAGKVRTVKDVLSNLGPNDEGFQIDRMSEAGVPQRLMTVFVDGVIDRDASTVRTHLPDGREGRHAFNGTDKVVFTTMLERPKARHRQESTGAFRPRVLFRGPKK